jgi:sulfotransferase famil protein
LRPITRFTKPYLNSIEDGARWLIVGRRDPRSYAFYTQLMAGGFAPNAHIDVLLEQRIIYVCVPKNASSRIKMTLGALLGRTLRSELEAHKRKLSGLKSPKRAGLTVFHRLATDPRALRFAFVRNPYARLVSCWFSKFRVPLILAKASVNSYLAWRQQNDPSLPEGATSTLSFDEFVNFATMTAQDRVDAHWHLQAGLLDMPGIELNLIGKVESFEQDFMRVLDHVQANDALRADVIKPANVSDHVDWRSYYTNELANRVYNAYELDFDRFQYSRKLASKFDIA